MKAKTTIQLLTIYQKVCEYFHTRPHYEPVRVRQVAQYVAFKTVPTSKFNIGYVIGGRDANTTANSIRKISNLIEPIRGRVQDKELKEQIRTLLN